MSRSNQHHKGRVSKIIHDNNYVVVYSPDISGAVTFSINPIDNIWKEEKPPIVGEHVQMMDIRMFDGGWRAFSACSIRPIISNQ